MKRAMVRAALLASCAIGATGTALAYTHSGQVTISQSSDVESSANTGSLVIGNSTGAQVAIDSNEIQARAANGGPAPLYLQDNGGEVRVGSSSQRVTIYSGNFSEISTATGRFVFTVDGEEGFRMHRPTPDELYLTLLGSRIEARAELWALEGFINVSSARYKTDIADLVPGLFEVLAMRPVSFRYKESGKSSMGFIAEEAFSTLPDLVKRETDGTIEGFDYISYTAVLTRAVQEQQRMIEDLDQRLEAERSTRSTLAERLTEQERELAATQRELARLSADFAALAGKLGR